MFSVRHIRHIYFAVGTAGFMSGISSLVMVGDSPTVEHPTS